MDNERIGEFIRQLRKEKDLTQKEVAEALHITDRAVSKWERGLNAPDIALLEPLSALLGGTVGELIRGERLEEPPVDDTRRLLEYSQGEMTRKIRGERKRYVAVLLLLLAVLGALLWRSGIFFLLDKTPSPDGRSVVRVYNKEQTSWPLGFTTRSAVQVIETDEEGRRIGGCCFLNDCHYEGLWWAPDSQTYLLALDWQGEQHLLLNGSTSLKPLLNNIGIYLEAQGYLQPDEKVIVSSTDFQFLQWGKDGESMLFYYSLDTNHTKKQGTVKEGYFWYNCRRNDISGIVEIQMRKTWYWG